MKIAPLFFVNTLVNTARLNAEQEDIANATDAERGVGREMYSIKMLNDIRLTDEQRLYLDGGIVSDGERAAVKNKEWKKWTDSDGNYIVPFFFDKSFGGTAQLRVKKALQDYTAWTCIRFEEVKENDSRYEHKIRVFNSGNGCYSYVGLIENKEVQDLSLDNECTDEAWEIQHEFMHALGFWHEMQRGDRDKYVIVNRISCLNDEFAWSVNYEPLGKNHPFIKDTWEQMDSAYDFNSIMQYDGTICQVGSKPVIAYRSSPTKAVRPNSKRMTSLDVFQLNSKYKCAEVNPILMKTQSCGRGAEKHRAFFIEGHRCDGYKDCDDGRDETNCKVPFAEENSVLQATHQFTHPVKPTKSPKPKNPKTTAAAEDKGHGNSDCDFRNIGESVIVALKEKKGKTTVSFTCQDKTRQPSISKLFCQHGKFFTTKKMQVEIDAKEKVKCENACINTLNPAYEKLFAKSDRNAFSEGKITITSKGTEVPFTCRETHETFTSLCGTNKKGKLQVQLLGDKADKKAFKKCE